MEGRPGYALAEDSFPIAVPLLLEGAGHRLPLGVGRMSERILSPHRLHAGVRGGTSALAGDRADWLDLTVAFPGLRRGERDRVRPEGYATLLSESGRGI